ncbi:Bug family tripartite tricarboxylate transporter substrate binding protein [Billgrantia lactosivorans]|uniref:Bug family tripartite tricarboxylate transporter substrate binding protein n=1 Tax=Billgrantia lactosivorans TaxID=2185141 RepID=UPI000DAE6772|nr:tripartite tricarboxylate transporter substrate-binding protein [Halomonas lactosivorans]
MKINTAFRCGSGLALLGGLLMAGSVQAQSEATECIAPAKPGGGYDLTCRLAANGLQESGMIERPMAVSYMPGGIGAVAYNHVNGVREDDPNLIVAASTGAAVNLALGKFGEYDATEVRWLGAIGVDYGAIVVSEDAPWQDLDELMDDLRENPQEIAIGAGGSIGSQDWMKAALAAKAAEVKPQDLRYVSFEGGGEAMAALLGDHIQVFTGDLSELRSQLESGKVRVLAALAEERVEGPYADIPTAVEQGYDVKWPIWRGYYMGPEVDDAAYESWVERLRDMEESDEFAQLREDQGLFPMALYGEEFDAYVQEQVAEFKALSDEVGLSQ